MERRSTLERHTIGAVLSATRGALHASIIEELLRAAAEGQPREAVLYAGGPAAGKSRLAERLGPVAEDGFVLINPDVVRTRLPEYQEILEAGDPEAGALTHEEASLVAKTATDVAISLGLPLLIDAVGGDDHGQFSSKILRLVDHGTTSRSAT